MALDPVLIGFASEPHYAEHLAPLIRAIPGAELRCATDAALAVGKAALGDRAHRGLPRGDIGPPILVAARKDLVRLPHSRDVGLLEHGAGQTYADHADHPSYAGGAGLERLRVVLAPGPHSAERWEKAYPTMPVVELCGTPRLDWQHGLARTFGPRRPPVPVVAFSFHWDCRVAPEAGATWPYWVGAIRSLAGRWETIGHAHPRAWNPALIDAYARAEVPTTHDFLDILDRASVYVCDNSSTMYEFAALDRPVICLDGPKYRRDVEHGLRFYDAAPGPRLADPARLGDAIARTILYPHEHRETRAKAMLRAYGGFPDGHSTQRAVAGIREHLL